MSREFSHEFRGQQYRVRIDCESASAVPLLVCNGFGFSLEALGRAIQPLRDQTIIRFDAPGFGYSSPRYFYRFGDLAAMLDDLLDSLDIDAVDVYGLSWGGMLAQEFALRYPHRCRKLVLAGTWAGLVSVPGNPLLSALRKRRGSRDSAARSRIASLLYGGEVEAQDLPLILGQLRRALGQNFGGVVGQLAAAAGWTSLHRLHAIEHPTLLLYGERDAVVPLVNGRMLQRLLPDAILLTTDCGHFFPWTRAGEVGQLITEFRSR